MNVFYSGGGQEKGVRGGTENVHGAVALADCLELYAIKGDLIKISRGDAETQSFNAEEERFLKAEKRMDKLIAALSKIDRCSFIPALRADTDSALFSPYILQVAFKGIPGEVMARALDDLGFAVSTGSACSSSSPERPVLLAMGVEERLRIEGIRISQGYTTTDEDIDLLAGAILEVLKFL